jgi:hypothetical protein
MRLENEQLKLALAEATVQLRIWRKGAEHIPEVAPQHDHTTGLIAQLVEMTEGAVVLIGAVLAAEGPANPAPIAPSSMPGSLTPANFLTVKMGRSRRRPV